MNQHILSRNGLFILVLAVQFLGSSRPASADPVPLINSHAHNDYEHPRPLLDALSHGFCSVEADIHLVNGELLVAHDLKNVKPDRTLQSLYLDPLMALANKNGGRIYPDGPEFNLLIDVKTIAEPTYIALREVLKQYDGMLTVCGPEGRKQGAVSAIITGNRNRQLIKADPVRYADCDGDMSDLNSTEKTDFIPWISNDWRKTILWNGVGPIPDPQKAKLKSLVEKAHAKNQKVRLWAAPDTPEVWKELLANGVDLINSDNLQGLQDFLMKEKPTAVSAGSGN